MKKHISSRNPAMDIIRCLALFGVVSTHFFYYSGFYNRYISGSRMYVLTIIRSASMVCVPLFLLLSGYLLQSKKPTRQYYLKIIKTVGIYFLASIFCYLSYLFFHGRALHSASVSELLRMTLGFDATFYSWYINMYIGLFLLIPYLNVLYQHLDSQKSKQALIITLLIITAVPHMINSSAYSSTGGWTLAVNAYENQILFPDYWIDFYPITYYFIGSYLKEYPIKLNRSLHTVAAAVSVLSIGTLNYCLSYGTAFREGPWQNFGSLLNAIQAVLIFSLLAQADYRNISPRTAHLFSRLSDLCLGGYLVSWIFDNYFHPILQHIQPVPEYKLEYYLPVTLAIYICSLSLSAVLNLIYHLFEKLFSVVLLKKTSQV